MLVLSISTSRLGSFGDACSTLSFVLPPPPQPIVLRVAAKHNSPSTGFMAQRNIEPPGNFQQNLYGLFLPTWMQQSCPTPAVLRHPHPEMNVSKHLQRNSAVKSR